jgi:sugar lactone lactonase YvrE
VALPGEGVVVAVSNEGDAGALAEDLNGPNGIHVTTDGTVWVTELPAGRIQIISPGADAAEPFLAAGEAPAVNGIYVDEDRGIVFFTNYAAGEIWRIDVAGTEEPTLVATIEGAALDGLTMDVCGNVYAVDQGNDRVFRVFTDGAGDQVGDAELIANLPSNVANAQFGRGAGFSATTLYAAGNPGDVYAIDLGVEGAAQAGP